MLSFQNIDAPSFRFAWYLAISQLKTKYRFTALGFLWNFLEPALYLVILSLVFSVINRMDISDYAVFLFSALVPWRYFEKVVITSMESIAGGEWLLKKMYVSPFTFPVNKFIISTFEFSFSITVAFIIFAFLKEDWTIHLIILPLSIIPWALFGIGLGMISAVLYIFFRDVRPLIQMILTLVFFTSPILFHQNIFAPDSLQASLMEYHPITYFAALFQKPIYTAIWPSGIDWLISVSISLLTVFTGYYLIQKFKNKFYFYL